LDAIDLPVVVTIARQIWFRRNSVVFGGSFAPPKIVFSTAVDQVEAFSTATALSVPKRPQPSTTCVPKWVSPPMGFVKLNWDASVDRKGQKMGIGLIVRDHAGGVVIMACESKKFVHNPAVAEALAARRGVELCAEWGIRKLLLEGDALQIVQALISDTGGWAPYDVITMDAKQKLQNFQEFDVMHVPREANCAAHCLAKLALTLGENRTWRDNFPACMHNVVTADLAI
jgi:hypothetical protein